MQSLAFLYKIYFSILKMCFIHTIKLCNTSICIFINVCFISVHCFHVMPVRLRAQDKSDLALNHNGKFPLSKIMLTHNCSFSLALSRAKNSRVQEQRESKESLPQDRSHNSWALSSHDSNPMLFFSVRIEPSFT